MATTSPDNLRTPDPGDPYNLVPDLATLANDVQAALNARDQNVLKGTGAQRAVAQSTATPGMLWVDTDGIKMIWRRGVTLWEPAVWQWSGTTSQMNAFTQAPNGFVWQNTTNNSEYLRISGAWRINSTSVLWSGSTTLASGTVTLSSPVSAQPAGVVLVWSLASGESTSMSTDYVPKLQVAATSGGDYRFYMGTGSPGASGVLANARKIVSLTDTQISGNAANGTTPADLYVLRRVIGV